VPARLVEKPSDRFAQEFDQLGHGSQLAVLLNLEGNDPAIQCFNLNPKVRREKALVYSGWKSRPGAGSFRPVTIEAVVEVTKPLKPSVQRVAKATR
jgi:hypothetical protein